MFGYIVPLKTELKIREYEVYSAYYCAICRSIKKRHGELPRLMLSFDSVFLAMLSASIMDVKDDFKVFRCFTDPTRKRNEAIATPHIDYAADMLVLLGYYSLKDDKEDDNSLVGNIGERLYRKYGEKISKIYPKKAEVIKKCLEIQAGLEKEKCSSIDRAADPFGKLMAEILAFPENLIDASKKDCAPEQVIAILKKLGYHLGRYIYVIDAIDDLDKDKKSDSYNPLKYAENVDMKSLGFALELDLSEITKTMDFLELHQYKNILENIVYLGMSGVKDELLSPGETPERKLKRKRYLNP